jgi:hypothetical protein
MSLEPLAPRYFEGVLLYVQLLTEAGERQRAGQVLDQLQDMLDAQQVGAGGLGAARAACAGPCCMCVPGHAGCAAVGGR